VGPQEYRWHTVSGFRGEKSRNNCNRNRDIPIRDISEAIRIVWGHRGVRERIGGTLFQRFVGRSPETSSSGFAISRSLNRRWSEGPSNSQLAHVSEFRHIGSRGR
jgi:hypothetical protein